MLVLSKLAKESMSSLVRFYSARQKLSQVDVQAGYLAVELFGERPVDVPPAVRLVPIRLHQRQDGLLGLGEADVDLSPGDCDGGGAFGFALDLDEEHAARVRVDRLDVVAWIIVG